jgi:Flp pilus assembly protein TadD
MVLGRHEEAVAQLRRCTRLNPYNARAHKLLGDALAATGHLKDAVLAYQRALAIEPAYPGARQGRRAALERLDPAP